LQGSIQADLIESGSGANTVLREMVQNVTGLVNFIGTLPPPVLQTGLAFTAVTGAGLGFVGLLFKAIPAINNFKEAYSSLGSIGKTAAVGIGIAAGALSALALVLSVVAQMNAQAAQKTEAYGTTLNAVNHSVTESTKKLTEQNLQMNIQALGTINTGRSANDIAKKYGISLQLVADAASGNKNAIKKLNEETAIQVFGASKLFQSAGKQGIAYQLATQDANDLRDAVAAENAAREKSISNAKDQASVDQSASGASQGLATSLEAEKAAGQGATDAISTLTQALQSYGSDALSARSATRAYQQALDDAQASLKTNGATLDDNTQKGRDNEAALDRIASSADAAAAAIYKQTGSTEQAGAALDAGRQAYIATAVQMGMTQQAAQDLAAQIIATPQQLAISVKVTGLDTAANQLEVFYGKVFGTISKLPKGQAILKATTPGSTFGAKSANGNIFAAFADGGFSENHIAQISAAGRTRIWGEPETGGEAYIPLAESK
jgi:hypothetical protein